MAFGDWDSYWTAGTTGENFAVLDISNPILGTGSLSHRGDSGVVPVRGGLITQLNSGFNRGLTKGRIRSLVRFDGAWIDDGGLVDSTGFVIYYMASNEDITGTSSDFYYASVARERNTAGEVRMDVGRVESGVRLDAAIGSDSVQHIAEGATNLTGVTGGDTLAIQIEWNLDLLSLGGMRHTMSVGNIGDVDFSNLSVIYDFVEPSPLEVSVVEGLSWGTDESVDMTVGDGGSWDSTGIFRL